MKTDISRRNLLSGLGAATASSTAAPAAVTSPAAKPQLCVFSKHFQWQSVPEMAALVSEIGFEAVDLTVRDAGHVLPGRVADDLPKAEETIRKAGLKLAMVTTGIVDVRSPHAEPVLKAASALGLKHYRWGGFKYSQAKSIPEQLVEFRARSKDLAAMNKSYGMCAMYHTHSGAGQVGASFWDLWEILKDLDNDAVSVNYDIGHATVEGGLGGWLHSSRLLMPMIRGTAIKDFHWAKGKKGWTPEWCGLGQGMVNFAEYFRMLKKGGFAGPIQVHFEYPELGDAHTGKTKSTIPRERFVAIMKRDLKVYKTLAAEAALG